MKLKELFFKILPYIYLSVFIFLTVLIFIQSAKDGDTSATSSSNLADYLQENFEPIHKIAEKSEDFPTLVRKFIGHYGLFALNGFFGILTFLSFSKSSVHAICYSALAITVISSVSELIQGATIGRTFAVTDIILNIQGYVSGSAIALILHLFTKRKRYETIYVSINSYALFLLLSILTLFLFYAISDKSESINACTSVEVIVITVWLIIEGLYITVKHRKHKHN